MYVHGHMHVYVCACVCVCMCAYMCVCVCMCRCYLQTCVCVCAYAHVRACEYDVHIVCVCMRMHACMYACVHACMCIHLGVCTQVLMLFSLHAEYYLMPVYELMLCHGAFVTSGCMRLRVSRVCVHACVCDTCA